LPAHGRAGARATSSLAAHFAKRNTKFGGGKALLRLSASDGQARAGKNSFPPTPFLFARPSLKVFQNSAFGFSLKKVRISFSVRSCEIYPRAKRLENKYQHPEALAEGQS